MRHPALLRLLLADAGRTVKRLVGWTLRYAVLRADLRYVHPPLPLTRAEVDALLKAYFPSGTLLRPLDGVYDPLTYAQLKAFLALDWADRYTGAEDRLDCDKFTWLLRAHALEGLRVNSVMFIIGWAGGHAYPGAIVRREGVPQVVVIEPQLNGKIILRESDLYVNRGLQILA